MKVLNMIEFYSGKSINIPDDIMVIDTSTILSNSTTKLCYSKSTSAWYVLSDMATPDTKNDIYSILVANGDWVDCISYFDPFPTRTDAPFKWGTIFPSKINVGLSYMPIYETVPTGEFNEDGLELTKDIYKIIAIYSPQYALSVSEYNQMAHIDVEDCGENLVDIIKTLQWRTGTHF